MPFPSSFPAQRGPNSLRPHAGQLLASCRGDGYIAPVAGAPRSKSEGANVYIYPLGRPCPWSYPHFLWIRTAYAQIFVLNNELGGSRTHAESVRSIGINIVSHTESTERPPIPCRFNSVIGIRCWRFATCCRTSQPRLANHSDEHLHVGDRIQRPTNLESNGNHLLADDWWILDLAWHGYGHVWCTKLANKSQEVIKGNQREKLRGTGVILT